MWKESGHVVRLVSVEEEAAECQAELVSEVPTFNLSFIAPAKGQSLTPITRESIQQVDESVYQKANVTLHLHV